MWIIIHIDNNITIIYIDYQVHSVQWKHFEGIQHKEFKFLIFAEIQLFDFKSSIIQKKKRISRKIINDYKARKPWGHPIIWGDNLPNKNSIVGKL